MTNIATLGGGCFWCTEAVFQEVKGVKSVVSGYSGGKSINPSYQEVSAGNSGHAECIEIEFDPSIINYEKILEIFYSIHDPTTLNRQGNDAGTQYRSVIFYHGEDQKKIAEKVTDGYAKEIWDDPIVTQIEPYTRFYPAEDYHQNFFKNNPNQAYCQVIINPKLKKFRQMFDSLIKAS